MTTLAERVREALARYPKLSQADLARAAEVSPASVSDWLSGETKSMKADKLRLAAEFLGCDRDWLGFGTGSPNWRTPAHQMSGAQLRGVDHQVSHPLIHNPPILNWGRVMNPKLPQRFVVEMIDESMAPDIRRGDLLEIDVELRPDPGDAVLVENAVGFWFVRTYQEVRPGQWRGVASHRAYADFDLDDPEHKVVGVVVQVTQRGRRSTRL